MRRNAACAIVMLATLCALAATGAAAWVTHHGGVRPLTEVTAPTPRFRLPHYVTSGRIPRLAGTSPRSQRVDAAIRRAIRGEQRLYARTARRYVKSEKASDPNGIYETWFRRRLSSASTVVVSALIPTLELYPMGNDGETWVSATVDVRTGRRVSLTQLVRGPGAFSVLSRDWQRAYRREHPKCSPWPNCLRYRPSYPATAQHLGTFALIPAGLAIGFPQYPAAGRLVAVIPYAKISSVLSPLGQRLVNGVRRPLAPR